MKRSTLAAALGVFLAGALLLASETTGHLMGQVTDSSGQPLEGVAILVTSPGLRTFKMTLKTDKNGKYSLILNDATIPYHVKFEKDGYLSAEADKKVGIGDTGVVDMKLLKPAESASSGKGLVAPAQPSTNEQAILAYNSGVDAMNAGDKAAAETQFLDAVKKNPDLSAGWQVLTQIAYDKKDWAKTLEYGNKATDLDPSLTGLYPMLADAAAKSGDAKAAAEWKAKANEANPAGAANELYNQGVAAYNKGKMKEAEAALTKAVEAKPDFANAHYLLGMASFNLNKKAAAKEHLEKYLELDPNGKEAGTVKEILPLLK